MLRRINRKGHIPTLLLFAEALVLILTAWYTFFTLDDKLGSYANSIRDAENLINDEAFYVSRLAPLIVERAVDRADKNNFDSSFSDSFKRIAAEVDLNSELSGNFFGKIRNGDFKVVHEGGSYSLIMQDVSVYSKSGENELTRTFDLEVRFDKIGLLGKKQGL